MFKIIKVITKLLRKLNLDRIFFDKIFFNIGLNQISENRKNYDNIDNIQQVELKVFSQNGEDGIIDYLLTKLKLIPHSTNFIEIGVGDYRESNTRFIYNRFHSKGVIIDCINDMKKKVKPHVNLWKGDLRICNSFINSNNINEILEKNCDFDVDVFSLDIDGIDYWIIQKLKKNISKIFIAEFNPVFGSKLKVTVPNIDNFDRTNYHYSNLCYGMSLSALIDVMKEKNFYFVGTNLQKMNAFFVSNDFNKKDFFNNLIIGSLENYTNSNIRDSRDINNNLNYLSGFEKKIKEIENCKVVNLETNKNDLVKIKDLIT
ncbi:hypothetical protein OAY12_04730 [Candidatus Pelagibacter sp.]|nr:hypothetical protein [Candidatus Pelagibacter sp.]